MHVLVVNTGEKTGDAAVTSSRLMHALNQSGVETEMLVKNKETDRFTIAQLPHRALKRLHLLWGC